MKALSVRQPWAWAILYAGKRIENRVWNTSYRGPVLLHAAKGCTKDEYESAVSWMIDAHVSTGLDIPPLSGMQRGGIVGRARIVDVVPPFSLPYVYERLPKGVDVRWHMTEQFGFVLADVEPLPFRPYKGALKLFDVEDPNGRP